MSLLIDRGAGALNMAAIAEAASVSRPTLYRYYPDLDAVLTGVADLVASHDDQMEAAASQEPDPLARLDLLLGMVVAAVDHSGATASLRASLPPPAREVLDRHESLIRRLLADTLTEGVGGGVFRREVSPVIDAPLILGLALAADPEHPDRAIDLAHRLVEPTPQEDIS
jgi:AcrR family transcriptional regulator